LDPPQIKETGKDGLIGNIAKNKFITENDVERQKNENIERQRQEKMREVDD
jgi:predicted homoserine dehydrogenase-like protein